MWNYHFLLYKLLIKSKFIFLNLDIKMFYLPIIFLMNFMCQALTS
jgi:hypothetical protein